MVNTGMVVGCLVYASTVVAVVTLLVLSGSCGRMRAQAAQYDAKGGGGAPPAPPAAATPMLYDELLAAASALPLKPALPAGGGGVLRSPYVELHPLDDEPGAPRERALALLAEACDGTARHAHGAYDPADVWRFVAAARERGASAAGSGDASASGAAAAAPAPFARRAPPDGRVFRIADAPTGYTIGSLSVLANRPADLACELGALWLHPAFRGGAHARAALALALEHLFALRYRRVEWRADARDRAGRRLAEALGFALEGVLRKHAITPAGTNRDVALYAMLNSDWADGGARARAAAAVERRARARGVVTRRSHFQSERATGGSGAGADPRRADEPLERHDLRAASAACGPTAANLSTWTTISVDTGKPKEA